MATQKFYDGFKDHHTQQAFLLQDRSNLDPVRYRCKMKEGVSTLLTTGMTSIIWAVDRGLGAGVERNNTSGLPCGQYVTLFLKPGGANFANGVYLKNAVMGKFLSQFETVFDPLPEWVGYFALDQNAIPILSPKFTAPQGIFDTAEIKRSTFAGSTFEVAPKIFTDAVMKEFTVFPPVKNRNTWAPFAGCPNVKKITPQGEFGERLEYLGPCDLTYYDEDGFAKLDGYPQGGAPAFIDSYVQVTGKLRLSEKFPSFNGSRLQMALHPWKIATVEIDSLGGPPMPFGGIDFSESPKMDKLWIWNPKWVVNLPLQPIEQMTFTFSWGSLGVAAPAECADVANLWTIFQHAPQEGAESWIMTPEALETRVHYNWGSNIDKFSTNKPELFTADFMPKVPSNLKRVENYYSKVLIGAEDEVFEGRAEVGGRHLKSFLDGTAATYTVQPLPATAIDVYGYCVNLYSDLEISTAITVPALPSALRVARDCYRRTFYNASGPPMAITPVEREPVVMLAFSKSSHNAVPDAFQIVGNLNEAYTGDFRTYFSEATASHILRCNAYDSQSAIATEPWDTFLEMLEGVKQPSVATVEVRVIKAPIVLERVPYNSLQFAGGWQEECFFGAGIDPTVVDALIHLPQKKEWNSYRRALNIDISHSFGQPLIFWRGELRIPAEFITETDRNVKFVVLVSYGGFDLAQFDSYKYQLEDVVWSGSPRTESSTVIAPYFQATSRETILGDRTAFLAAKGIVLNSPESFSTGAGTSVTQFVQFWGVPFGLQAARYYDPEQALVYARSGWSFYVSYLKQPSRFNSDYLKKTPTNGFYFEPPMWVDSDSVRRLPGNTTATVSSQGDLNAATALFNG